jgi:hypothetical protein
MTEVAARYAACRCEQLRLLAEGEPVRISICHCLDCQRRTGSAFGVQARFAADAVQIEGDYAEYERASDAGEGRTFYFCPKCGATVFFRVAGADQLIGVPVGAFADPTFPAPTVSVWGRRRHQWLELPTHVEQLEADD